MKADSEESDSDIARHVNHGRTELRRLRLRLCFLTLGIAALMSGVYEAWVYARWHWNPMIYQPGMEWCAACVNFADELFFTARFLVIGLAPLPDDLCMSRSALAIEIALVMSVRVTTLNHWFRHREQGWWNFLGTDNIYFRNIVLAVFYFNGLMFICVSMVAMCQTVVSAVQGGMWRANAILITMNMLAILGRNLYLLVTKGVLHPCLAQVPVELGMLLIVQRPDVLGHMQAKVRRWLQRRGSTAAAAGIACLIGDCPPESAVAQARDRFRSVMFSELCLEGLQQNVPDPALSGLAHPVALGDCDAFISHSWHDDPLTKWRSLQMYAANFTSEHGCEPSLWFDKYCIDQNNIDLDLRCLPVFLSGCRQLVVLLGPSYLSRLWCIMELFAYVHSGGSVRNIQLILLLRERQEPADYEAIKSAIDDFDVETCCCQKPADHKRIMVIIRTAFGTTRYFNTLVRRILRSLALGPSFSSMGDLDLLGSMPHIIETSLTASTSDSDSSGSTND